MTRLMSIRSFTARSLRGFLADRRGATAIEYGLIVALIGVTIMGTIFSVGRGINNTLYSVITNALASM
jgi:Flp pilus assembly pilin Flp